MNGTVYFEISVLVLKIMVIFGTVFLVLWMLANFVKGWRQYYQKRAFDTEIPRRNYEQ